MSKLKFMSFIFMGLLTLSSCGNGDDEPEQSKTENDLEATRYYVKYETYVKSGYKNIIYTTTFTSDKGLQTFESEGSTEWTATYGPLTYGSVVSLKINRDSKYAYSYGDYNQARIYVSKNQEPFVIKAEDSGGKNINLLYQIDF